MQDEDAIAVLLSCLSARVRQFMLSSALSQFGVSLQANDLCKDAVKDATSVQVVKKVIKTDGPKDTYNTTNSAMLQVMLTMVNRQVRMPHSHCWV